MLPLPASHRRHTLRLQGYDYALAGAYYVTICIHGRMGLFGEVAGDAMHTNPAGDMVTWWWQELANKYPGVIPDVHVVMPNHFHGVIIISGDPVGADLCVRPNAMDIGPRGAGGQTGQPIPRDTTTHGLGGHVGPPLPQIVQWFKTMTTNAYVRGVRTQGWPPFERRLWQRGYYEHIIRSDDEYGRIGEYIVRNPAQWASDRENPLAGGRLIRDP